MLNRVILMGRITADPELKTTPNGVNVTSFSLAVDRNGGKGDERKTDFFNIVCWRHTADFVTKYFKKGSLIALEGQLQSRTYQAKDGSNRYIVEVVADNVSFTGERNTNSSTPSSQAPAAPAAPVAAAPVAPAANDFGDLDFAAPVAPAANDFGDLDFGDLPFDM